MFSKSSAIALVALSLVSFASLTNAGPKQPITQIKAVRSECSLKLDFQNAMRMLWEDHIQWTRSYLVSSAGNLGDREVVLQRLMKNQADLGMAIKPYYGEEASMQLTMLLGDHIKYAGAIISAMIIGDKDGAAKATEWWKGNANDIAMFLNKANPDHWPLDVLQKMLWEHLDLTSMEVTAQINGEFQASVDAYDKIHAQILDMADALSHGIIMQHPDKFECY